MRHKCIYWQETKWESIISNDYFDESWYVWYDAGSGHLPATAC